jgi:uncharacterized damage-inducible protein DinB
MMTQTEQLISELQAEAMTTRRVLERVPEGKLTWKPHVKSMSLGQLALHIANVPGAIADVLSVLEREPTRAPLPQPGSHAEVMQTLEASVAKASAALKGWGDAGLAEEWRMRRANSTLLALPRGAMVRAIMLNHWYHHRGEMMVYLRLCDVLLPSVYGPTADENPFG